MSRQLDLVLEPPDPPKQPRTAALVSHHVRSHQTADEALAGEAQARGQELAILAFFRAYPDLRFTPSEVHGKALSASLVTSVRRALSNLTARGRLVHYPADRRPGPHGSQESTWGLA